MSVLSTETVSHMTVSDVVEATRTNIDTGLNQSEVTQRRSYHGFNEFEISKEEPLWKKYLGEVQHAQRDLARNHSGPTSVKSRKKSVLTPRNVREKSNTVIYYKTPTKHRH